MSEFETVTVVGAGLAGCECALQLAKRGVRVRLCEQRPLSTTAAHHTDGTYSSPQEVSSILMKASLVIS